MLLTALSSHLEFMQALKIAIIVLAIGGAIMCGLLLLPFLTRLDGCALAAIGLVWIGGWFASRPLHVAGSNMKLVVFAVVVIVLAIGFLRMHGLPSLAVKPLFQREAWPAAKQTATLVVQLLAIALCFALGYRINLLFGSTFPLLYLLLALGSWPLLHRALSVSGSWILSGFLSAVLYLAAASVLFFYDLSLVKQYQLILVAIFLFIAIWRDDIRVFWALPLLLLFDMQNGARLCALIIAGEGLVGLLRRQMPIAILPAIFTAVVGVIVTAKTAYYPFDDRLYNLSDAVGVVTTPVVLMAGFVALIILWTAASRNPPDAASPVALDRMLVYAASVVVMAAVQIPTRGLLFDAFQLSTLLRSVAVAPIMAIFFVTFGMLLTTYRTSGSDVDRRSAIASIAALLLVMSTTRGRDISFLQLSEGVRASLGTYLPTDWSRRTPYMTLADNTIYYDLDNLATAALMQYSVIKIRLLSRNPEFSHDKLTILPFGQRPR